MQFGVAPTVMWGKHRQQPHRWTKIDVALALAYYAYSRQVCPDCGHSTVLTFNQFHAGEFEYHDDKYCLACEVKENHADEKREPGQKRYVVNLIGTDDDEPDDEPEEVEDVS